METRTNEKKTLERAVRVFISSTFRDMHEEREELVKQVFPELRRLCDSRMMANPNRTLCRAGPHREFLAPLWREAPQ